ncbi:SMP-30/gluconolactonase/LRE family protein [candidate division KSB3 bacterium]|uniref:SMP-30/gluconolactonase/LRE family protein n=1 Tax=candidate division KSB3 bacterium TaxID=2044937 RepID=A0A9D5K0Q5_9BACT|nr:SMP-30/gluconolactonase/LRE family protein [candidate division KSB3 bacterium]MBD3327648.1 SMP-30/gluconolactonase/LRE family protein [candidate division KSB3 bacterium]
MKPEMIADTHCVTGEGPLWHPLEQKLYWLDIPPGIIYRYDPATDSHEQVYQGDVIGGFTIQADGALLLFMDRGAVKIWREGTLTTVLEDIPAERDTRFNDVIADPEGRVFCGTMPAKDHLGRLYRLDPDGSLTQILDGIGISNGMGFTPDRTQMYYTDSAKGEIYLFEYDRQSGSLSNQRVFLKVQDAGVEPDGLTVDAAGYLWSARWNGNCVVRIAPDGSEDFRIPFPAKKVSCMTFGGSDYTELYVTTAGGDNRAEEGSGAGALFRITLEIQGVPEFFSRIGL